MNLGRLKEELSLIVRDNSLAKYFTQWLNDALEEIAFEHDLPALKMAQPRRFPVNDGEWLYFLPDDYHKRLFMVVNGSGDEVVMLRSLEALDAMDESHTIVGNLVTRAAVLDRKIGIYPKANDELLLWYYVKPPVMQADSDEPVGIPPAFRRRVLLSKVVIRNFMILQDLMTEPPHNSLTWWQEEYRSGLYGSQRGDIGMINLFVRDRMPKRWGGRQSLP